MNSEENTKTYSTRNFGARKFTVIVSSPWYLRPRAAVRCAAAWPAGSSSPLLSSSPAVALWFSGVVFADGGTWDFTTPDER
jgi:hypothetical protein